MERTLLFRMMNCGSDDVSSSPQEETCPVLEVEIGGQKEQALVDTGANASAIDRGKLREIQLRLNVPSSPVYGLNIRGAFGERTRVKYQATLPLKLKEVILPTKCNVVESMSTNIILGVDFLRMYGGVIDLRKEQMRFEDSGLSDIPLVHEKNIQSVQNSAKDITSGGSYQVHRSPGEDGKMRGKQEHTWWSGYAKNSILGPSDCSATSLECSGQKTIVEAAGEQPIDAQLASSMVEMLECSVIYERMDRLTDLVQEY